jgi:hypothetical protein
VNFSPFDTEDVNFKAFQGTLGLQYSITPWLSSALNYSFRWLDSGSGSDQYRFTDKGGCEN